MMFCEYPEKFFGYTYVQRTSFPQGSVENPSISEDFPDITGSVLQMIQATMERFRNLIIREKVIKVSNQMEALRIFNYPYQAIEEAVVNAFYHRDYMSYEPVTIEIELDLSEGHSSGISTIQEELEKNGSPSHENQDSNSSGILRK
jgi:ATP-dependent DNA helicase RecG